MLMTLHGKEFAYKVNHEYKNSAVPLFLCIHLLKEPKSNKSRNICIKFVVLQKLSKHLSSRDASPIQLEGHSVERILSLRPQQSPLKGTGKASSLDIAPLTILDPRGS